MKNKYLFKLATLLTIVTTVVIFSVFLMKNKKKEKATDLNIRDSASLQVSEISDKIGEIADKQGKELPEDKTDNLPDKVLLDVPFLSQAPFADWNALHEDACEEASLITVELFRDGVKSVAKEKAEEEIQEMIAYEERNGHEISITLEELNKIAKDYYNLNTGRVKKNVTIDDIKKELAAGRPVIVGAAGKILPNPNFRNGGPNYHMLVIKGYDSRGFITNDPGTRKGEGFRYTFQALFSAIHDWNPDNIMNGQKNYLVFD